jgi:hypothetical protein
MAHRISPAFVRGFSIAASVPLAAWLAWARPWRRHFSPSQRLEALLPGAEFRDTISIRIDAPPSAVFQAFREVTLAEMPLAWGLGELRYLPQRLSGRAAPSPGHTPFLELLHSGGTIILAEEPDREVVVGSIGRLYRWSDQTFVPLSNAEAFRVFDAPGYEKLAMSIRVEDVDATGCTLVLEHWTKALDETARRRFARYWLAIKPFGAFVTYQMFRAIRRRAELSHGPPRSPTAARG